VSTFITCVRTARPPRLLSTMQGAEATACVHLLHICSSIPSVYLLEVYSAILGCLPTCWVSSVLWTGRLFLHFRCYHFTFGTIVCGAHTHITCYVGGLILLCRYCCYSDWVLKRGDMTVDALLFSFLSLYIPEARTVSLLVMEGWW
jgi:hypothetical protein